MLDILLHEEEGKEDAEVTIIIVGCKGEMKLKRLQGKDCLGSDISLDASCLLQE